MVLVFGSGIFVFVDDGVDKLENFKSLLTALLSEVHEEIGSSDIGGGSLLKVCELAVEVLLGFVFELFEIVFGQAEHGEDEVGDEIGQVWLQVRPHLLGTNSFVEENEGVGKTGPAEPGRLGHPFFDLVEVVLQDFGRNVGDEVLCKSHGVSLLARDGRVAVSGGVSRECERRGGCGIPNKQAIQVEVGPFLGLPPVVGFAFSRVFLHGVGRGSFGDGLEEDGAPGNVGFGDAKSGSEFELIRGQRRGPTVSCIV